MEDSLAFLSRRLAEERLAVQATQDPTVRARHALMVKRYEDAISALGAIDEDGNERD